MSSYKELLEKREELDAKLEEAFKEERLTVLDEIKRKMKIHGISLDEIRGGQISTKQKVAAKYRDPISGKEWSGRGKPPAWIKDVPDRTKFLIAA